MEKEPIIFGKDLTPEREEIVREDIRREKAEASRPLERELNKTPDELKMIALADSWLDQEFRELGIEGRPDIGPDRVHFLTDEEFRKRCDHKDFAAFASFPGENIYVNEAGARNRLELYVMVMHEAVHVSALEKFHARFGKTDKEYTYQQYRRGYKSANPAEDHHEHFRGLAEAVTDKTVIELFNKHKDEAIRELVITPEEEKLPVSFYHNEIKVLDAVIAGVAKQKNVSRQAVWQEFKEGQFTGRMTHLKDVEKAFGKGSLRVLAAMGSAGSTRGSVGPEEMDEKIVAYFMAEDEKTREKLASEILSERERLRYQKRRVK